MAVFRIESTGFAILFSEAMLPIGISFDRKLKFLLIYLALIFPILSSFAGALKSNELFDNSVFVDIDSEIIELHPALVTLNGVIFLSPSATNLGVLGLKKAEDGYFVPFSNLHYLHAEKLDK